METINLIHDIELEISTALNRKSKTWKNRICKWSDIITKLSEPVVTSETYEEFMKASKDVQGNIKDRGAFVGGHLAGGKRGKNNVVSRQVIALDLDFSHNEIWWDFTNLYQCAAVIHSTHKSCEEKPRHRLVIPLDRAVNRDEYEAISRRIAGNLNIDLFDQSTFEFNRMMFWPTISKDSKYYFEYQDGEILSADAVLNTYDDWKDVSEWPTPEDFTEKISRGIDKQEDPEKKKGIIGYFCRTYDIDTAIDEFLSDVYRRDDDNEHRYTFIEGTTFGGMMTYEGKFSYSYHTSDPSRERLCNAFDLVRIHKFGHLDSGSEKKDTEKKSFKAMEEFASQDKLVRKTISEESLENAKSAFKDEFEALDKEMQENGDSDDEETEKEDWRGELEANAKGEFENSATNINLILKNDKFLKGAFRLNTFNNKRYLIHSVPWRTINGEEPLKDVDYSGLRNYIECAYGIVSNQKVDDSLSLQFEKHKYHPIRDYIESLEWDGTPRINTLLQDYFGADDNVYVSASIRKMLCAAVARVFQPGIKFDLVLILVGAQGTYKSTFVKKLGGEYFSDTFTTVQGKEAFEQIQGAWIIEMAELSGLRKAEIESIKHYISKKEDSFRPAYGRVVETFPRQCVFFGTTNNKDFLRDPTGNRRFLPIDVHHERATKSVMDDFTEEERDQVWAEAYQLYKQGEPLYLLGDENRLAVEEQRLHSEMDDRRGTIERYLNVLLPDNWEDLDIVARKNYFSGANANTGTIKRETVCVAEIWCECLGDSFANMKRFNTREINEIMRSIPGWRPTNSTKKFTNYGSQRYYVREEEIEQDVTDNDMDEI